MPKTSGTLAIRAASLDSSTARALIAALDAELDGYYPEPGANHFRLDADEVAPGRGVFLVAWLDGQPVGCGAVRRIPEGTDAGPAAGEIKRMYVGRSARGRGVGYALLTALEKAAREMGLRRLLLETGDRQTEAVTLYRRAGFAEVARFGEYRDSPLSLCMAKVLVPGS